MTANYAMTSRKVRLRERYSVDYVRVGERMGSSPVPSCFNSASVVSFEKMASPLLVTPWGRVQDRYNLNVPGVLFRDLKLPTLPHNHRDSTTRVDSPKGRSAQFRVKYPSRARTRLHSSKSSTEQKGGL